MGMANYENPFAMECNQYAHKFDEAFGFEDWDTTKILIRECEDLIKLYPGDYRYAPIYYSLGTSYSDLMGHALEYSGDYIQEKILYYYRSCFELLSDKKLEEPRYKPYVTGLKLPLLTNYANALDSCGRKISAIRYYRKALEIRHDFNMAVGNIGVALLHYSMIVHDPGHRNYLNHFAYRYLKIVLEDTNGEVDLKAKAHFQSVIDGYDTHYIKEFLEKPLHINKYTWDSNEETNYRNWCLRNHLFLNPLNDLPLEHSCFAADTLQLPGIVTPVGENDIPIYFGLFNQIKQEFIYARYLCYQGQLFSDEPHYADKETCLVDLYDYPQYSIRIEHEKAAFRLLYSLFDKVAFFANTYWKLGIKERDITFHSIWREESGHKHKYKHAALDTTNNVSLLSIKWIYRDFNDRFGDSAHPELQKFNMLRNALKGLSYDKDGIASGFEYNEFYLHDISNISFVVHSVDEMSDKTSIITLLCKGNISVDCYYEDYDNAAWDSETKDYVFLDTIKMREEHNARFACRIELDRVAKVFKLFPFTVILGGDSRKDRYKVEKRANMKYEQEIQDEDRKSLGFIPLGSYEAYLEEDLPNSDMAEEIIEQFEKMNVLHCAFEEFCISYNSLLDKLNTLDSRKIIKLISEELEGISDFPGVADIENIEDDEIEEIQQWVNIKCGNASAIADENRLPDTLNYGESIVINGVDGSKIIFTMDEIAITPTEGSEEIINIYLSDEQGRIASGHVKLTVGYLDFDEDGGAADGTDDNIEYVYCEIIEKINNYIVEQHQKTENESKIVEVIEIALS